MENTSEKLNTSVAVTVALLATFMGICKVKDDNICQNMQALQASKVDHWNYYQARNIREEIAKSTVVQLKLGATGRTGAELTAYQEAIKTYENLAEDQRRKKEDAKKVAEQDEKDYALANDRDDQFDLSDALLAISVAMLAVTALTGKRWLFAVAMVPTAFGVFMGMAGLFGWPFHPTVLVALLS